MGGRLSTIFSTCLLSKYVHKMLKRLSPLSLSLGQTSKHAPILWPLEMCWFLRLITLYGLNKMGGRLSPPFTGPCLWVYKTYH
ncbi:uncharacterized protein H6S33_011076 [Morchella sextelata]|uniref:uncharacterized protein n=1 Tax=Morchella sextelata TaxID=1174677 RepID=UPI001D03A981|nr:uncharacterized protein H6S33_011076 [Morchella sextelata]KAH0611811.1 hypothetical protein H6S33_011076 [Morchella sextelata]